MRIKTTKKAEMATGIKIISVRVNGFSNNIVVVVVVGTVVVSIGLKYCDFDTVISDGIMN